MGSSSTSFRTPDDRFDGLPGWDFAPRYVEQDGLRMHHVDEGEGDPVLLLHGEPTWAYLYRRVIPQLAPAARVVAPDWFGFGRSDKPLDAEWYSYDAHYASLERLVEQLDLQRITLVVHDWGGPLGFRLCAERPERIERLVVLNTGILAGRAPNEVWLRFREMVRRVGTDIQPGRMVQAATARELAEEVVAAYDAPFPTPESRVGVVRFPELLPTEPGHPSFGAMSAVAEAMRSWAKPTLVFFGDSDPIFPPQAAERVAAYLHGACLPPVERAGHFVQEDDGEEVGQRIANWLASV
jgi:haloalkane dehalogenase